MTQFFINRPHATLQVQKDGKLAQETNEYLHEGVYIAHAHLNKTHIHINKKRRIQIRLAVHTYQHTHTNECKHMVSSGVEHFALRGLGNSESPPTSTYTCILPPTRVRTSTLPPTSSCTCILQPTRMHTSAKRTILKKKLRHLYVHTHTEY